MPTSERASKVPGPLTLPWPGLYGVNSVSQRATPTELGVVNTFLTMNFASSSCVPNGERPGVPCGTSGGPKQVTSLYEPSAVSAPLVGSTYTGSVIVWPATLRLRIQTAACPPGAQASEKCWIALSVTTLPLSGSVRPVSRANPEAVTSPIVVAAGALRFAV